ncbi:MAG: thermonuclease family protein [Acidobacteria bacterium]|nr:thermonuclease family protein [Acidobacteriota bacterium]
MRKVVDGDTIDVQGLGRVRLLGINAPELGFGLDTPAPFATEARDRLAALVVNRWVVLEYELRGRDAYHRRLAYVLIENGRCVNATLVREGLARVSAREALSRLSELKRAEAEAQTFRRGIWGDQRSRPVERYTLPHPKEPRKPQKSRRRKSASGAHRREPF